MNRFLIRIALLLVWACAVLGCSSTHDSGKKGAISPAAGADSSDIDASSPDAPTAADASLSALVPSVGALIPVFGPTRTNYTLRVPNGTTSVTLTPTATNAGATVRLDGVDAASGAAAQALTLASDGSGLDISVIVTAADSVTTSTYQVHVAVQSSSAGLTIHSVGDSTMANYDATADPNQRGWMQMFPKFTTGSVTVDNGGINGTSSKSYYVSGSWDVMKNKLNAGDYVFIQFGHNDEKDAGIEGKGGIGTAAWGGYHDYLTKYVAETRALGAIPILFTPVVRLGWSGATLTPVACHDLTGNGIAVGDANYPEAMRDVAKTLNAPLVDLTVATKALAEEYGPTDAKSILYINTDDTHLQVMGATVYAQLAVQGLISLDIVSDQLNPVLGLQFNEATLDFGTRYLGSTLDRAFSVLGLSLAPDAGNVTFIAPAGFLIGMDPRKMGATLELPYTRGALPPTIVYVRFQPAIAQKYADSLTSSPGHGAAQKVALAAAALDVPIGGAEVEASYALDAASSGVACTTTGTITCADEAFSDLYIKDYAPLTTLLPEPTPLPTQRLGILSTPSADSWPVETSVTRDRYVELSVTGRAGKSLSIDTVSLFAGGSGGPSMAFQVQSSTRADFSSPAMLLDAPDNATNTLTFYSSSPLASVAPGETFHLRIFPYSKAAATKKYLSLASVVVHGVAF
jgi:lysophospholipase L1-like esterase